MSGKNESRWQRIKRGLGLTRKGPPADRSGAGPQGGGLGVEARRQPASYGPVALPEHATQFASGRDSASGAGAPDATATIAIGFDWGTSCTKVVLRDSYGLNSPSYLVDFGDLGHASQPFLLPSKLYIDGTGRASLCPGEETVEVPHIKLLLIKGGRRPIGIEALDGLAPLSHEAAALYVAAALRSVRGWFLREHAQSYRQYVIDWELNLGIPAANYDHEPLCSLFREVARVGWWLSVNEGPLLLDRAREGFRLAADGGLSGGLEDHAVNVIPEVAAQVVGYARSRHRREGLHVLVDVGAATLDVAGFILHERKGADCYSILEANVVSKGAFRLHQARVGAVTSSVNEWGRPRPSDHAPWCDELEASCTPMVEVPSGMRDYYPREVRLSITPPSEPDGSYAKECRRAIHRVLHNIRRHRDPNSPAWSGGLPIFVCGGGQTLRPYKKGLVALNGWWQENTLVAPFVAKALPRPDNLTAHDLEDGDFHRISVAYGLSHSAFDIGDMRPPSEIDDIDVQTTRQERLRYEDTKDWT